MRRRPWIPLLALAILVGACSGSDAPGTAPTTTSDPAAATGQDGTGGADAPEPAFLHAEPDPVDGGRIVDDQGREVLLRGVNVNSYAEYWSGNDFPTVFPFTEADADRIAGFGWNTVRLLFTWSSVEPEAGTYDEAYIDELDGAVRMLADRGIYSILDSHQDAWGPTLAARPDEDCPDGTVPANGWDGAPGWATLVPDDVARCATGGIRETSPAVRAAAAAFFANDEGPGGVGIRTRYAEMWGHLATRFADDPAVAGYDLLNEPNAFTDGELVGLADLYSESLAEIRAAEDGPGGRSHMILFEPSALWSSQGSGAPPAWDHDANVVYSPHIYQGAFNGDSITRDAFEVTVDEAGQLGGAPILTGEWGTAFENHSGTQRTGPDGDDYFIDHQGWQDELHISATIWEWRESCGDPHKVKPDEDLADQQVSGPFEVDCATNEVVSERTELISDLTRPYPMASPGRLVSTTYDEPAGGLEVVGTDAEAETEMVVFWPTAKHGEPEVAATGLEGIEVHDSGDGWSHIVGLTTDADWTLEVVGEAP